MNVVGAVIVEEDQILCAQRGNTKSLPYKWEFPGGKIEKDETPVDALIREIQEEMLCHIKVHEHIADATYEYDFAIVHLTTYACSIKEGFPQSTEHTQLVWRSIDQLDELDWAAADLPTIDALKSKA
ncbi:8-oxo-dGTP diphosphatase [Salisediminibacterium halotolerans]|nr:8-oxo-dGTP diphosphatase [Actinophytocola xinjiangensis]RPE88344.1 8-oxo-dGTP diphosphatase [Salisediminibacterium halotolerans]TWG37293.1 8-oxo-dGTP diphosphatase [Salisediminibacterium halotolerans]